MMMFFWIVDSLCALKLPTIHTPKNWYNCAIILGCFLKWWVYPQSPHPKCWSFLVGKPHGFVGETHHFRSCPPMLFLQKVGPFSSEQKKSRRLFTLKEESNSWEVPRFHSLTIIPKVGGHDPLGSMYGVYTYIYHKNQPNVGKYTIHGSYGPGLAVWLPSLGVFLQHKTSWNPES